MEPQLVFHDFLPLMAQKLGSHGLMQELAKGFQLLADPSTNTITLSSLRRSIEAMGMKPMSDCDLLDMMSLGGVPSSQHHLDLHQFCVAIIRSSPDLMEQALEILLGEDDSDMTETEEEQAAQA